MEYSKYAVIEYAAPQFPRIRDALCDEGDAFERWLDAREERRSTIVPFMDEMERFVLNSTVRLMDGRKADDSFVYSPISVWLCLYLLMQITEGRSRVQIESVLGAGDHDAQAEAVRKAVCWDDGESACVPGASLWLNEGVGISEAAKEKLSAKAGASVYRGVMGDAEYDRALRVWINEKTNGLLSETVSRFGFEPNGMLSVCATLWMKSTWSEAFRPEDTGPGIFHARDGDVTTDFMHGTCEGAVFRGGAFTAVVKPFRDGGSVILLLPDEGIPPEELLRQEETYRFLFGSGRENADCGPVSLTMPKVDCMAGTPLREMLEKLGVTDVFDCRTADFSGAIAGSGQPVLSSLQQHARLVMDELGVEASAVTASDVLGVIAPPQEEREFILDRPFVFAVMEEKDIPLFVGFVNRAPQR